MWLSVFAAFALGVPLLCAGALLIHEHGEAGHHLHALAQSMAVQPEPGWQVRHEHEHDAERAGVAARRATDARARFGAYEAGAPRGRTVDLRGFPRGRAAQRARRGLPGAC